MKNAIAIGMLGIALLSNGVAAQTAVEQAQILRDFEQSVNDYARHQCPTMFPEAVNAAAPAPKIFTLPVAMVFRQLIARAIAAPSGSAMSGVTAPRRTSVLEPFPETEPAEFPKVFREGLPAIPAPLEYRLIGNDLVIRDAHADVIIAVLRDALGVTTTRY